MQLTFETTIPTSSSAQLLKSNLCPDVLVVVGNVCGHFITKWWTQAYSGGPKQASSPRVAPSAGASVRLSANQVHPLLENGFVVGLCSAGRKWFGFVFRMEIQGEGGRGEILALNSF